MQQHGGHGLGPAVHGHGAVGGGGEAGRLALEGGGEGPGVGGDGEMCSLFKGFVNFANLQLPHRTSALLFLLQRKFILLPKMQEKNGKNCVTTGGGSHWQPQTRLLQEPGMWSQAEARGDGGA